MPNCNLSPIIQLPPISDMSPVIQPLAQVPNVPSPSISDTSTIQPTAQVPTVPSSPIFDTVIIQPMVQVPIVPSPPIFDTSIIRPMAQVPIVPSPPIFNTSIIQPSAQVPTVPSLPISEMSPIIQPLAQVPTVPSPYITAPNPQMDSLISFPGFAPNLTQTFFPTFDANPDESLMDLMSESLYSWPNQAQQEIGDRDLFNFSGLQDFSGMNNFNSDRSLHLPDMNVRLVLQGPRIFIHINIHSSPRLSHSWTATISTATISMATLSQISTGCPTSTLTLRLMPTPCLTSL